MIALQERQRPKSATAPIKSHSSVRTDSRCLLHTKSRSNDTEAVPSYPIRNLSPSVASSHSPTPKPALHPPALEQSAPPLTESTSFSQRVHLYPHPDSVISRTQSNRSTPSEHTPDAQAGKRKLNRTQRRRRRLAEACMQLYEQAIEQQRRRQAQQEAAEVAAVAAAQRTRARPLSPRVYAPKTLVGTPSKPAVCFCHMPQVCHLMCRAFSGQVSNRYRAFADLGWEADCI